MNNEIKEILKNWKIGIETGKDKYGIKVDGIGYTWKELNLLLDYITNLQQENKDLKESNHNWQRKLSDYKIRIEKAVKYIEKEKSNYMRSCDISNATNREGLIISSAVRTCDDTLKILRGNNER